MDTVIITIYGPNKFKIDHRFLFLPELTVRRYEDLSFTERESKEPYIRRFILRPPETADYLPGVEVFETLTEDRKSLRYALKLDFSAPKLLFGNSLQEITEADKGFIFHRVKTALAGVGIIVEIKDIAEANVTAVHFCKNIALPREMKMRDVLDELKKVDINKTVDVTLKEYKSGGRVLSIYSGTVERAFYDKISDALKPKNKRKDKNHIDREREIIERFKLQDREVFRYEYRLKKTQTVRRDLSRALERKYGPISFGDLFTAGLFKKMAFGSWRAFIKRPENQLALFGSTNNLKLLLHITAEAQKLGLTAHSLNKGLISYGLARAIGDHGAKEVHGILSESWCKEHPERLTKKIQTAADLTDTIPYSNNISFIDKAIEDFIPITFEFLQDGI